VDVPECGPGVRLLVPANWEESDPGSEPGLARSIAHRTAGAVQACSMFRPRTQDGLPILLVARLDRPFAAASEEEVEQRFAPLKAYGLNTTRVGIDPASRLVRVQLKDVPSGYALNVFIPDNSSAALLFVAPETTAAGYESTFVRIARSLR
jgi:hypothetical protein